MLSNALLDEIHDLAIESRTEPVGDTVSSEHGDARSVREISLHLLQGFLRADEIGQGDEPDDGNAEVGPCSRHKHVDCAPIQTDSPRSCYGARKS